MLLKRKQNNEVRNFYRKDDDRTTSDIFSKTMELKTIKVNPRMAKRFLDLNFGNRPLRPKKIAEYASVMKAGLWDESTGETIKFDAKGRLRDGQHRLNALIIADIELKYAVATGVGCDSFKVMDTGAKRTPGDTLAVAGFKNHNAIAAIARRYYSYCKSGESGIHSPFIPPSNKEILQIVKNNRDIIDAHEFVKRECRAWTSKFITYTNLGFLYLIFSRKNKLDAEVFFKQLEGKYTMCRTITTLKNKLSLQQHGYYTTNFTIAIIIKTWNAFRTNKTIKVLRFRDGEELPEPI